MGLEQTQPVGQLFPEIGEQPPPQGVTQVQVVESSRWGAVQVMVGSQVQAQVAGSCTLPVPQAVGHSQAQLAVLRTLGAVQVLVQTHPQVAGSCTLPGPQVVAAHSQIGENVKREPGRGAHCPRALAYSWTELVAQAAAPLGLA